MDISTFLSRILTIQAIAGGNTKYVPLRPAKGSSSAGDWKLDMKEFEAAITPKTKLVIINTPQNVPGTMIMRIFHVLHDWKRLHCSAVVSNRVKH